MQDRGAARVRSGVRHLPDGLRGAPGCREGGIRARIVADGGDALDALGQRDRGGLRLPLAQQPGIGLL